MNFRDLVEKKRARKPTERPISMEVMADRCGITRSHLYNLMGGLKSATPWTTARIARGLGVAATTVTRALEKTAEEALAG